MFGSFASSKWRPSTHAKTYTRVAKCMTIAHTHTKKHAPIRSACVNRILQNHSKGAVRRVAAPQLYLFIAKYRKYEWWWSPVLYLVGGLFMRSE